MSVRGFRVVVVVMVVGSPGTRRRPMDRNARTRRNRGHLSESRTAGHQGQDSSDWKDSTDFHWNVPSSLEI
jgi:hypothetical protein